METSNRYDLGPSSHGKTMPLRMYRTLQTSPLFADYVDKDRQKLHRLDIQEITKIFEENYVELRNLFSYDWADLPETLAWLKKYALWTSESYYSFKKQEILNALLNKEGKHILDGISIWAENPSAVSLFSKTVDSQRLLCMSNKMGEGELISIVRDILDRIANVGDFARFFNDIDDEKLMKILQVRGEDIYIVEYLVNEVNAGDLYVYVENSDIDSILLEMKDYKSLIASLNE